MVMVRDIRVKNGEFPISTGSLPESVFIVEFADGSIRSLSFCYPLDSNTLIGGLRKFADQMETKTK